MALLKKFFHFFNIRNNLFDKMNIQKRGLETQSLDKGGYKKYANWLTENSNYNCRMEEHFYAKSQKEKSFEKYLKGPLFVN